MKYNGLLFQASLQWRIITMDPLSLAWCWPSRGSVDLDRPVLHLVLIKAATHLVTIFDFICVYNVLTVMSASQLKPVFIFSWLTFL